MTGLWRGTGDGTGDLALKSHNSTGQEESRTVFAGGILCRLPQLNYPSLYSVSLCLAFTLVSVFPSFLYFTYLSLFLSPLSIFVAFTFFFCLVFTICFSVPMVSISLVIPSFFLQSTSYSHFLDQHTFSPWFYLPKSAQGAERVHAK